MGERWVIATDDWRKVGELHRDKPEWPWRYRGRWPTGWSWGLCPGLYPEVDGEYLEAKLRELAEMRFRVLISKGGALEIQIPQMDRMLILAPPWGRKWKTWYWTFDKPQIRYQGYVWKCLVSMGRWMIGVYWGELLETLRLRGRTNGY